MNEFNANTEPIPFYQFTASGILVNFIGLSMLLTLFYPCTRYYKRGKNLCDSNSSIGMANKYSVLTFVCTFV